MKDLLTDERGYWSQTKIGVWLAFPLMAYAIHAEADAALIGACLAFIGGLRANSKIQSVKK